MGVNDKIPQLTKNPKMMPDFCLSGAFPPIVMDILLKQQSHWKNILRIVSTSKLTCMLTIVL